MNKAELITWLATLPDESPDLARVDAVRHGAEPEEDWLSLKEVAAKVRKHVVWLARLRVPEVCGERLAGRRSYKLARVLDYLKSEDCRKRIAELNAQRKGHEASAKLQGKES